MNPRKIIKMSLYHNSFQKVGNSIKTIQTSDLNPMVLMEGSDEGALDEVEDERWLILL